jgi:hypothetical protein
LVTYRLCYCLFHTVNQSFVNIEVYIFKGIFLEYLHFAMFTLSSFSINTQTVSAFSTDDPTWPTGLEVPKFLCSILLCAYRPRAVHCNNFSVNPELCSKLLKSVNKSTNPSIDSKPILFLNSLSVYNIVYKL